ncbi:hypothetical protein INT43_008586 [Umbelopsis isabellina]|uniref:Methyltransferase n=1 Tax=Mortierella isabellina TaxID=91625 RepID=A0A8H7PUX3_MORIS|nr:hypothetical protein INT43_008586 [Umbelopsis isabellina]
MAKSIAVSLCTDAPLPHYCPNIPKKETHEDYYKDVYLKLSYNQSLFRINLHRSTQKAIRVAQWSRVDLCLVNEVGLPLVDDMGDDVQVQLKCKVLSKGRHNFIDNQLYDIEIRPLQDDAWSSNEQKDQYLVGFYNSSYGGLEYRLQYRHNADIELDASQYHEIYLYIQQAPLENSSHAAKVLPLAIGPMVVNKPVQTTKDVCASSMPMWSAIVAQKPYPVALPCKSVDNGFWDQKQNTNRAYRAYPLISLDKNCYQHYVLMEEKWKLGMPGKIWDGALVATDIFAKRLKRDPSFLDNRHVLDLSAGSGCFGLTLAAAYQHMRQPHPTDRLVKPPLITLTDVQEALPLIRHNYLLNMLPQQVRECRCPTNVPEGYFRDQAIVSIQPLRWGFQCDALKIMTVKPIDYLVASDVLYDSSKSSALAQTLIHLSTPGITTVYLVYKKRALKREDEEAFFKDCQKYFDINIMPTFCDDSDSNLYRDETSLDGATWLTQDVDEPSTKPANMVKTTNVVIYQLKRK